MAFNINSYFEGLVSHLIRRKRELRALAVMSATEHWVQFEGAALLATKRDQFGLGGSKNGVPKWLVAAERGKLDLWITNYKTAYVIEFKAVHNNKNFYEKVRQTRSDLSRSKIPDDYPLPPAAAPPRRWAIVVLTYTHYQSGQEGHFSPLRAERQLVQGSEFQELLRGELRSLDQRYEKMPSAKILDVRPIVELDDAPYIERGHGSCVALALVGGCNG